MNELLSQMLSNADPSQVEGLARFFKTGPGQYGEGNICKAMSTEKHPFEPFLPGGARILFLGSFPPQPHRWRMPSTSRAYPLPLEKKAAAYQQLF